ncbi:MAG: phage recombination protein Bet [Fimbriimonadales bacterium]|nr:phage recombination protein Bet [Fimbriimonadales bacterium]
MTDLVEAKQHAITAYTDAERRLIRETFARGTTDDQFALYLWTARSRGLDPRAGQIHAVVRKARAKDERGNWVERPQMTIQTGIDGYRLIAQRSGEYEGKAGPYWCGPDGVWQDVWVKDEPPFAAKVGVRRRGDADYSWHVALYREYVQLVDEYDENGRRTGAKVPNAMWAKSPANMLAKCAEAGALRSRFPEDLAGIYVDAEYAVVATIDEANEQRVRGAERVIQRPRAKSATKEVSVAAVVDEDGVIVEEQASPAPDGSGFTAFWIELQEMLDGSPWDLGHVGMVLNCGSNPADFERWWEANRERGNLLAYIRRKLEALQ